MSDIKLTGCQRALGLSTGDMFFCGDALEKDDQPASSGKEIKKGEIVLCISCAHEKNKELKKKIEGLEEVLAFYAEEKEWSTNDEGNWKLLFNSSSIDGHGYEQAKIALKEAEKGG